MINIINKALCCGCSACVQICPKNCISFEEDNEGFRYPRVNLQHCIECSQCEQVCPELNRFFERPVKSLYGANSLDDDVRRKSSSGGVFSLIAESIIKQGGVVFGARFDDKFEVVLDFAVTLEQLDSFRGSKYLQAIAGDSYKKCKTFLDSGRQVLFTGTPCQISGLLHFLRKPYPNLLTVDFICHGVPSPLVWRYYFNEVVSAGERALRDAKFRNSRYGWKRYRFSIEYDDAMDSAVFSSPMEKNPYMNAFLKNVILRPSCYACPAKNGGSMSDITLGDFWGIEHLVPELNDDLGTSLILIHTDKGRSFIPFDRIKSKCLGNEALQYNPSYTVSSKPSAKRDSFFHAFARTNRLNNILVKYSQPSLRTRFILLIYKFLKRSSVNSKDCKNAGLSAGRGNDECSFNNNRKLDKYNPFMVSFRDKSMGWKHYVLRFEMMFITKK